jgi:hypothetical protein
MDEVRKVIKACYEEVWTILQEHRCAAEGTCVQPSESKE